MHPILFARKLEEQLKRVRLQFSEVNTSSNYFDISSDRLLDNAKAWFLHTINNADLDDDGQDVDPLYFLSDESISRSDFNPYQLKNPSIAWMICQLDREQIESIFGVSYYDRLMETARQSGLISRREASMSENNEE